MNRLEEYDVFELPVDSIYYDEKFNCRGEFTTESIQNLAKGIEKYGLLYPLVVEPYSEKFRIIAGHRRFRAMQYLKYTTVKASIRTNLSAHSAQLLNLLENIERRDLNIMEESLALRRLYPRGKSIKDAAKELHQSTRWVRIRFKLLRLPEEIQRHAAAGVLSARSLEMLCEKPKSERIYACRQLVEAKKNRRFGKLPESLKLRADVQRDSRRTRNEMEVMTAKMLSLGIRGLAPRSIAWCNCHISTDELLGDIKRYKEHGRRSRRKT